MTTPQPTLRWFGPTPDWLILVLFGRGIPALAVGAVLVVPVQSPPGLGGPDRRGGGGRDISGHAALAHRALVFRLHFQFSIRSLLDPHRCRRHPRVAGYAVEDAKQVRTGKRTQRRQLIKLGGSVEWSEPSRPNVVAGV